jgi:hypothetical protein
MDQLDSVFQSILKCHNFSEHLELEVWIREALTMKTISFIIFQKQLSLLYEFNHRKGKTKSYIRRYKLLGRIAHLHSIESNSSHVLL